MLVRPITVEEGIAAVKKVFDRCYNDMEPIGRRIRRSNVQADLAYSEAYLLGYDWFETYMPQGIFSLLDNLRMFRRWFLMVVIIKKVYFIGFNWNFIYNSKNLVKFHVSLGNSVICLTINLYYLTWSSDLPSYYFFDEYFSLDFFF